MKTRMPSGPRCSRPRPTSWQAPFSTRWKALVKGEDTNIRRDLKIRIVSTFNGRNNKFFNLWEKAEENGYAKHLVTIYDAIADGMPLDADKLKAALDDPDAWAQEYECVPMDTSAVLLTYELLAGCESPEASTLLPAGVLGRFLSCSVVHGPGLRPQARPLRGLDEREARRSGPDDGGAGDGQDEHARPGEPVRPRIQKAQRISVDYTGPGIGMGDYLVEEFGEWNPAKHLYGKVELVTFTNTAKLELFSKMRMAFERREVRIPINRTIREDLHSINRVVSSAGNVTYRAPQTEDGHADRATALSLAIRAATGIATSYSATLCVNMITQGQVLNRMERTQEVWAGRPRSLRRKSILRGGCRVLADSCGKPVATRNSLLHGAAKCHQAKGGPA